MDDSNGCRPPTSAYLAKNGWKYDAFLLHAGENKPFVEKLYWDLCSKGILAFFDNESLRLGDRADPIMKDELECGSRFVVPILTHELKGKPWPEDELRKALARHNKQVNNVILPVFSIPADTCLESTISPIKEVSRIAGIERNFKVQEDDDSFLRRISSRIEEEIKKDTLKRGSEDETDSGPAVRASSHNDSASEYASKLTKLAESGGLGGFWEKDTKIPVDVVEAVCRLGAVPGSLAARLQVTQGDLSEKPKADTPVNAISTILEIWTSNNGSDASLEVLFTVLQRMQLLKKLQAKLKI